MNKFLRFFLPWFILVSLLTSLSALDENGTSSKDNSLLASQETSLRGRLLSHRRYHANVKCNTYPKICHVKGSPGKSCCKKKCVNLSSDRLNCGICGKKCKYAEICCKGKCANPLSDKKNCGGCHKKCKKGHKCVRGMCNYA